MYRKAKGKRAAVQWRVENPKLMNNTNKTVISAYEKARFTLLRLDENLPHGGIRTTNLFTQKKNLLMDIALNGSNMEGCFFICSLLDMGEYMMTSGGGIPIDATSNAGKSTLTLLKKYFKKLQTAKSEITVNTIKCAREVYGFCLRGGALENMHIK